MAYSEQTIAAVWQGARAFSDIAAEQWRRDFCGAWMRREHYGNERSEFGWKIVNVSPGGPDDVANLRAVHHANGYDMANQAPKCHVRADDAEVPASAHSREPRNRPV